MITNEQYDRAVSILMDNGIEEDERGIVLQALGYVLLDEEFGENGENVLLASGGAL